MASDSEISRVIRLIERQEYYVPVRRTKGTVQNGSSFDNSSSWLILYDGLNRVDGSARFGFGQSKALASVSGPIEVRLAAEQPSRATFEVTVRPLSGIPGTGAKSLANSIRAALTPSLLLAQHPRTLIQLVVQSLTSTSSSRPPPSLIASIINASTTALLNAGSVPMRGVVCAAAVARLHTTSTPSVAHLVLDPSDSELASATASGCFAFLFAHGLSRANGAERQKMSCESVWSTWQASGAFTKDELARAQDLAKRGSKLVWQAMKESISSVSAQSQSKKLPQSQGSGPDDNDFMEI